jgi:D-sedoheptulose 7-phosphate isomerase
VTSLTELLQGLNEPPVQAPAEVPAKSFSTAFIAETIAILEQVDTGEIEHMAVGLAQVRQSGGRLFILGVGGSAGHAVNDFRKICGFEAYAPTDNVSELTARANDEGWESCFSAWLEGSRISSKDAVLVFSVGGGSVEKNVSMNIVKALETAGAAGAHVFGIVGRDGGFTHQVSESCVVIPTVAAERVTAHTEGLCAVIWHLLVSHPLLQRAGTKWESLR